MRWSVCVCEASAVWTTDERKYVAFDAHGIELVNNATVGKFKVRRNRKITVPASAPQQNHVAASSNEYSDSIEIACGARWVDAHLDSLLEMRYGDAIGMHVSAFDDHRVPIEVDGMWAIDGAHGSIIGAQLFDVVEVCR